MTLPIEVQREVRQLDDDVQSIYELLAGISATQIRHGNRFEELQVKLDTLGQDLETRLHAVRQELGMTRQELQTKLEAVRQELGTTRQGLEGRLERPEGRFDGLEGRFDGVEGRFDGVEARLDTVIRLVGGQAG